MTTVAAICFTALVIAWLGRGAHDGRLRLAAQRMQLEAGKREDGAVQALERRVDVLEKHAKEQGDAIERMRNAQELARGGRR